MSERVRIQFLSFVFGVVCAVPVISFADSAPSRSREERTVVKHVQDTITSAVAIEKPQATKSNSKGASRNAAKVAQATQKASPKAGAKATVKLSQKNVSQGKTASKDA